MPAPNKARSKTAQLITDADDIRATCESIWRTGKSSENLSQLLDAAFRARFTSEEDITSLLPALRSNEFRRRQLVTLVLRAFSWPAHSRRLRKKVCRAFSEVIENGASGKELFIEALATLWRIGSTKDRLLVEQALKKPLAGAQRREYALVLADYGAGTTNNVIALLADTVRRESVSISTRVEAAEALGSMGPAAQSSLPVLEKLLRRNRDDPELLNRCRAAWKAISGRSDPPGPSDLIDRPQPDSVLRDDVPSNELRDRQTPSAESLDKEITAIQGLIVIKLNLWLASLVGSRFETKADALELVRTVVRLTRKAGCQLLLDGAPITLTARTGTRQGAPSIIIYGRSRGARTERSTVEFPRVTAAPEV